MFKIFRTIPFAFLRSHFQFSSTSSSSPSKKFTEIASTNPFLGYLINSLGFREADAIAVYSEVPHLKSTANSNLVVNIFKEYGLDDVQIRDIVSMAPRILTVKPNKTLEPKLKVFRELGLPGPDLVTLVKRNPYIFRKGLHTQIIPTVDYLRNLLGCDEKVVQLINRSKWMLLPNKTLERISANILLLKEYGLSDEKITKLLVTDPQRMKQTPELVESKLQFLEQKLGISRDSPILIHGLIAVMYKSESAIEKNIQVFRRFGWSDLEIGRLLRCQPYCLNKSEAYIVDKLNYFMKELDYRPSYLMGCTSLWTLSLEKRIKPRTEIFNILKERKVVKDASCLTTIVNYSESKFVDFLKKFESRVPGLCETYENRLRNTKVG